MYHGCGCKYGNEDILHLIDGDASCLLHLLQIERLQIDLKQVGLYVLPFPTFALLAPLQLDFLHTANELVGYITVASSLLKVFIVELSALFEEENYPACVKRCPKQEDKEDAEIIDCKNDTEYQKCEEREEQT